jgi:hypothetical protein
MTDDFRDAMDADSRRVDSPGYEDQLLLDRNTMLDTAAIARRYEATDVWSDGYKAGVHDARGERASVVSTAFAVGILVGGAFATAVALLLTRGGP